MAGITTKMTKEVSMTSAMRITLTSALLAFESMCVDEIKEKEGIPGEIKAVKENRNHLEQIVLLFEELELEPGDVV